MKLIENKKVALYGRARNIAVVAKAAVVDTEGAHTTVAHFLYGENPWGSTKTCVFRCRWDK